MREAAFIKQNKAKWLEYEAIFYSKKDTAVDADKKARLYLIIVDDLAYAQTNYPKSKITDYLNQLASHTYLSIYSTKKIEKGKRFHFLLNEVPQIAYEYRKTIYFSFALFFIIVALGVISSANDHNFTRYVLGDNYVDMTTICEIRNSKPKAMGEFVEYKTPRNQPSSQQLLYPPSSSMKFKNASK